jgi:hypothetical protein
MEPKTNAKPIEKPDYELDEDGNIIDPITYLPIPKDRLVQFISNDKNKYFDIDVLYKYYINNHLSKPLDPYTRQKLPIEIRKKVYAYSKSVSCHISIKVLSGKKYGFNVPYHRQIGWLISQIISKVSSLKLTALSLIDIVNLNLVIDDTVNSKKERSLYDFDLETDIVKTHINLKLTPFTSDENKIQSLIKLCDYTSDKLYEERTCNERINDLAQSIINGLIAKDEQLNDQDIENINAESDELNGFNDHLDFITELLLQSPVILSDQFFHGQRGAMIYMSLPEGNHRRMDDRSQRRNQEDSDDDIPDLVSS